MGVEGVPAGETTLADWRAENSGSTPRQETTASRQPRSGSTSSTTGGRGAVARQPEQFRSMWLDNFGRDRPTTPPEPLTRRQLKAIRTPTLALTGEHGMPYSRRIAELVAGCVSGCRLVDVPGVTHFMSYQAPSVFNGLVLDFLAEHA